MLTAFNNGDVFFSPHGQYLGGGGGNTVQVFDPGTTGEYVTLLTPYKGGVFVKFNIGTTYFTPDGLHPAGGGNDPPDSYVGTGASDRDGGGRRRADRIHQRQHLPAPTATTWVVTAARPKRVEDGGPSGMIVKMMTPYSGPFVTYTDGQVYHPRRPLSSRGRQWLRGLPRWCDSDRDHAV